MYSSSVQNGELFVSLVQGNSKPEFFRLMKETTPDIIKKKCIYVNEILKIKDSKYII